MVNTEMPSLVPFVNQQLKKPVSTKWSGPLTSFQSKIEANKENRAYMLGSEAGYKELSMISPFTPGSDADVEWVDGYLDAVFLKRI